jgi:hypothetical protein
MLMIYLFCWHFICILHAEIHYILFFQYPDIEMLPTTQKINNIFPSMLKHSICIYSFKTKDTTLAIVGSMLNHSSALDCSVVACRLTFLSLKCQLLCNLIIGSLALSFSTRSLLNRGLRPEAFS